MFGFKMPQMGGGGSPWGQMSNQQRLMSVGSALQGDQDGLSAILSQIAGNGASPMMNAEGDDIAAAFGGMLQPERRPMGPVMDRSGQDISAAFGMVPQRRRFGFGRR